jgi:hypothetical protein
MNTKCIIVILSLFMASAIATSNESDICSFICNTQVILLKVWKFKKFPKSLTNVFKKIRKNAKWIWWLASMIAHKKATK